MSRAGACIILTGLTLQFSSAAQAYVGPTLGLGVIGTVFAVLAVALLSLTAFVILPIRRMLAKSKKKTADDDTDASN
jgi:uncharacterized membrane protein